MFVLLQTEQLKELKQEIMKQEEQLREVKKNSTTLERKLEYERYAMLLGFQLNVEYNGVILVILTSYFFVLIW